MESVFVAHYTVQREILVDKILVNLADCKRNAKILTAKMK